MKSKKGISLIVLVITIIVIIILAGAVILSLANDNPIESANEATFKTNVAEYNSELAMAITNKYLQDNSFDSATFDAGVWDGTGTGDGTIKQYITSMSEVDAAKFEIQSSKLVYVGTNVTEQDWVTSMGMVNGEVTPPEETGLGLNVIATDNVTFNEEAAAYNNPIIPKGFMAIEDGAVWPTDWNNGLVIEDASGNQFVWVPVDGTNVPYAKWCTTGISYSTTSDDSILSGAVVENTQVTNYGGFYIARYESMFDYNSGSIRVASKVSTNKTISSWTRDNSHTGYLWNYINYTDAKTYSENMAASYSYDALKVKSGLVTGTEWDTAMKWIQNASISVTDSRTWGNHSDSTSPANVGNGSLQISGFSENWKAKNIYDLAGNTWEWTNEIYSSYRVGRGGGYDDNGSSYPAACRDFNNTTSAYSNVGFRVGLYVL
ncbi:MAG: SUMF1/EgtB/PvdO family nonheme iron enzyme [Clostridia bacterium]|nr:SUMF1/EgtB/PvdO family nonheme iron enzyme [Clostridia bacterium]MDD4387152.1 SUMF1/EgtB/PvdO family nonheme iron enzyme [Clostridia bacterium]